MSRCTSLSGLKFTSPLPLKAIKVDKRVVEFSNIQTPETTIISFINDGKADTLYKSFRQLFLNNKIENAFQKLEEAVKYRNDIFTVLNQKFIQIYLSKYNNYRSILQKYSESLKLLREENGSLKNEVKNMIEQNLHEYEILTTYYSDEITDLNIGKNDLEIELSDLKLELDESKKKNKILIEDSNKLFQRLNTVQNELSNKENEINKKDKNCTQLQEKIYRLESKWYTKLFG